MASESPAAMDPARTEILEWAFERASGLSLPNREAFLEDVCPDDIETRGQIRDLVAASESADQFFDRLFAACFSPTAWSAASEISEDSAEREEGSEPDSKLDPMVGSEVGSYRILERLGGGGMGVVYRVRDQKLERDIALKFLPAHLSQDAVSKQRLLAEARAVAALDHQNVCTVYEVGEDDHGRLFIAMAYYEGDTLASRLEGGPLPVEEALAYAHQIAEAIAAAHAAGIIHRDIKPGNVIVTPNGVVKVLDFGLAKVADASLTQPGVVPGTVAYMSPEQVRGEPYDHRADIWALGVVLYEMLTGRRPFVGDELGALLHAILTESPVAPRERQPDVPEAIDRAVLQALSKDPAQRPESAVQLLESMFGTAPESIPRVVAAPPVSRIRRDSWPPRRLVVWGAAASVAVATGIGIAVRQRQPSQTVVDAEIGLSFAVVPFDPQGAEGGDAGGLATSSDLNVEIAQELARQLNGWRPARAASSVTLAEAARVLGLPDARARSLDEGLRLARETAMETLVSIATLRRGDSAIVEAEIFSAGSGNRLRSRPILRTAALDDLPGLAAPIAHDLLELEGPTDRLVGWRQESADLESARLLTIGIERLERRHFASAERQLRLAIAADTTFASAHHYLALTLYWLSRRDVMRTGELAPEIQQLSATASRLGNSLPAPVSDHFRAFDAFQQGRYVEAKRHYASLTGRDSSDVYAWLGLGMIESKDPVAVRDPSGRLQPRGNWGEALQAYKRAVALSPGFYLAYGDLLSLYYRVAEDIAGTQCSGFRDGDATSERRRPTEPPAAGLQVALCPMVDRGLVHWVEPGAWPARLSTGEISPQGIAMVDTTMRRARVEIRRWSDLAPSEPGPSDALSRWLITMRVINRFVGRGDRTDSLLREAVRASEIALNLTPDTTPEALVRLGSLNLALGDLHAAANYSERAVAATSRSGDPWAVRLLPAEAANTFLARGQPRAAASILSANWARWNDFSISDPVDGGVIAPGNVLGTLARLQVYGATGAAGDVVQSGFQELEDAWSAPTYDPRRAGLLRRETTGRVATALILDATTLERWFRGWDSIPPLWKGYLSALEDPTAAGQALDEYLVSMRAGATAAQAYYLAGELARRLGRPAVAVDLLARVDDLDLSIDRFDAGWGLRGLARIRRAQAHEDQGDTGMARRLYERFLNDWEHADSGSSALVSEAREALTRLP